MLDWEDISLSSVKWKTGLLGPFFPDKKVAGGQCKKPALRHSRERGKKEWEETGGGEQGHSKEEEGCVFTDLVRAMNPPSPSFLTHHLAPRLTCKGHFQFKQYQTDRNKRREEKEIAKPWEERQAGGQMRLKKESARSGWIWEISLWKQNKAKGIQNKLMTTTGRIRNMKPFISCAVLDFCVYSPTITTSKHKAAFNKIRALLRNAITAKI